MYVSDVARIKAIEAFDLGLMIQRELSRRTHIPQPRYDVHLGLACVQIAEVIE